jgi:hypothetical protein
MNDAAGLIGTNGINFNVKLDHTDIFILAGSLLAVGFLLGISLIFINKAIK